MKNHPIYDKARAARGDDGKCYLETKDVAALLRTALASKFPGVKFSIRSSLYSGGSSVSIRWTDGPRERDVEAIADGYQFRGFDGSIDLAYSVDHWLAPDGSITLAHSKGTTGARGSDPEEIGDPTDPRALLVYGGAGYVNCSRRRTPALEAELAAMVAERFGIIVSHETPYYAQTVEGESLSTWMHRESSGYYDVR
jgi:hypothetical protein